MKKMFFVGALMLFAVGATFMSCEKDSAANGCKCTYTYQEGRYSETETETFTPSEMKKAGFSSCSAFAKFQETQYDNYSYDYDYYGNLSVSCKGL